MQKSVAAQHCGPEKRIIGFTSEVIAEYVSTITIGPVSLISLLPPFP